MGRHIRTDTAKLITRLGLGGWNRISGLCPKCGSTVTRIPRLPLTKSCTSCNCYLGFDSNSSIPTCHKCGNGTYVPVTVDEDIVDAGAHALDSRAKTQGRGGTFNYWDAIHIYSKCEHCNDGQWIQILNWPGDAKYKISLYRNFDVAYSALRKLYTAVKSSLQLSTTGMPIPNDWDEKRSAAFLLDVMPCISSVMGPSIDEMTSRLLLIFDGFTREDMLAGRGYAQRLLEQGDEAYTKAIRAEIRRLRTLDQEQRDSLFDLCSVMEFENRAARKHIRYAIKTWGTGKK